MAALLSVLLLTLLPQGSAEAQVTVSPTSLEWSSGDTSERAIYVNASGPWTADIWPDGGQFALDSPEGEGSDFIHVAPTSAYAGTSDYWTTLTVRDTAGGFAPVTLILRAPAPAPSPEPQDSTERLDIPGNWILRRTYTSTGRGTFREELTFHDGLGYPEQMVRVGAGALTGRNVVTPVTYDLMRRADAKTWLPYVSASDSGRAEEPLSGVEAAQASWYSSAGYGGDSDCAFSALEYEASPLDRPLKSYRAGADYAAGSGGRPVALSYGSNAEGEVRLLAVDAGGGLVVSGFWPAGTLVCTRVTDEDGRISDAFTDAFGRTVLERRTGDGTSLDTYRVHDPMGNEAWTISPGGSALLPDGGTWAVPGLADANGTAASRFCTVRRFSGRGWILTRKLPGRETEEYVYDASGRVVMERGGEARAAGKWITYSYDAHGHLSERRLLSGSGTREHFQSLFASSARPAEAYPVTAVPLERTLRGDRSQEGAQGLGFLAVEGVTSMHDPDMGAGLPTWSETAVLSPTGGYGAVSGYVVRAFHYDSLGRPIQTAERWPDGTVCRTSLGYDFAGNVTAEREACGTHAKLTLRTFDNEGRLISESVSADGGAEAKIAYAYDDLGHPRGMTLGSGSGAVSVTDTCDIRGWLTGRSAAKGVTSSSQGAPLFTMSLRRGRPERPSSSPARWSGQASEWSWRHGTAAPQTLSLSYDGFGRLTDTRRYEGTSSAPLRTYTEGDISYTPDGDLASLSRYGASGSLPETLLSYTYTGLRRDGWTYGRDGGVTSGPLEGVAVEYDITGGAAVLREGGAVKAVYARLSDGTKAAVETADGGGRRYRGSFVLLEDGTVESVGFSCGRILRRASTGAVDDVRYHVTDHLGSVRATVDAQGAVRSRSDYHPFGGRTGTYAETGDADGRWRFSGKEWQEEPAGLPLLDFGARLYDPAAVSWLTQDPLSEKYPSLSPYSYCAGDPITYVDTEGRVIETAWDVVNVGLGVVSLRDNIRKRNFMGAALDAVGLIYDVTATAIPVLPAGASSGIKALRAVDRGLDTADAAVTAARMADGAAAGARVFSVGQELSRASEFGVGSYSALRREVTARYGKSSGLEVHHLIEGRFARNLGVKAADMPAVVMTREEHRAFTNRWREAIGYNSKNGIYERAMSTTTADKQQIQDAAQKIYKDYPDLLGAINEYLGNLK